MESQNFGIVELHQWIGQMSLDDTCIEKPAKHDNTALHDAIMMNDVDTCLELVDKVDVGAKNLKGETPLHLAARWKISGGVQLIQILVAAGADVNVRNKWQQTPLHYAVTAEACGNVSELLKSPSIDTTVTDVNGYTPLHCCFSVNTDRSFTNDCDLDVNAPFITMAEALIHSGASINSQTQCSYSILHFAAIRDDNTPLIKHLLATYPDIDVTLKNDMGENFLHVYFIHEVCEEITETLEYIAENRSQEDVKKLLSDADVYLRTPWEYLIDSANVIPGTIESILKYGVSVDTCDNFGNTPLHRVVSVPEGCVLTDVIDLLIKEGADFHKENIYGETPAFMFYLEDVFDVLNKHKINFNCQDRWGRSPLMSILKHRPKPSIIRKLVLEGNANLNETDAYGSTALHFAAYQNYEEQVEVLLELGADKAAKDVLDETFVDIVRRHWSYRCQNIIKMTDTFENVSQVKKLNDEVIFELPKNVKASSVTSLRSVEKAMELPDFRIPFWDYLLHNFYDRSPENASEVDNIVSEVYTLVLSLNKKIATYNPIFQMSIFPTGSSAEKTKVGRPDEFDFVLCIDGLAEITTPVITKVCKDTGFGCLKFLENAVPAEYLPFCDAEGYFLAFPFLLLFDRYLKRALNEAIIWSSGNLHYNYEDKLKAMRRKPVFNFDVYWVGCIYKHIKISIDLVPAVYNPGWWPANVNTTKIPLMNEEIKKSGCFLILQSWLHEWDTNRHPFDFNVNVTCNSEKDMNLRRMLRVSAAPAEISLMKSLPEKFRRAYALAKILKSKEVCPMVQIDYIDIWTPLLSLRRKFEMEMKSIVQANPSHIIKSYMLKNCLFYTMLEMKQRGQDQVAVHPSTITARIFQYLLHFADKSYLNPFFLPYSDVFEFEKDDKSVYSHFMIRLKRELSIKLILGMLQKRFPEECLSSKLRFI